MKTINVEITGTTPLLMHSPKAMLEKKKGMTRKTEHYDPKEDAEKVAYRKADGELYIPAAALMGCLINAASWKKLGKYAARPIIAAAVRVEPFEIGLGTKDYEIDMRTVVVQRARIVRARPRLDKWKAKFKVIYNEKMIADPTIIKEILVEGGERVGILDFSPRKLGSFGCFKVSEWKGAK